MNYSAFIGIDVSKSTIDVFLRDKNAHSRFKNNDKGFVSMTAGLIKQIPGNMADSLFVFEHTGLYSTPLAGFLHHNGFRFAIVPGLEIKRSMGITRGKSDKIDAKTIAEYAYEKREKIRLHRMPSMVVSRLKSLLSLRERMVKERAAFKKRLGEYALFLERGENDILFEAQERMLAHYDREINRIEEEMNGLIQKDETLKTQFKLATGIKGIGPQTALMLIVLTNGFTQFDSWRKFASYCGIAPFPNSSGKYMGKSRTSHLANKGIKAMLSCCAVCAVRHNPEMKMYYERRIAEGKHEMSTLNIIRNKLLSRVFAIVRRGTPYVETFKYVG
jgi:transposase